MVILFILIKSGYTTFLNQFENDCSSPGLYFFNIKRVASVINVADKPTTLGNSSDDLKATVDAVSGEVCLIYLE